MDVITSKSSLMNRKFSEFKNLYLKFYVFFNIFNSVSSIITKKWWNSFVIMLLTVVCDFFPCSTYLKQYKVKRNVHVSKWNLKSIMYIVVSHVKYIFKNIVEWKKVFFLIYFSEYSILFKVRFLYVILR